MKLLLRLPKAIILTVICLMPFILLLSGMIWFLVSFESTWGRYFAIPLMVFIVFLGFKFVLSLFMAFVAFLMSEKVEFSKVFQVAVIDTFQETEPFLLVVLGFIGIWMTFTSNQFINLSGWLENEPNELASLILIYLGIYEVLRISERKNDFRLHIGDNEKDEKRPKLRYPLGIYIESILVMSIWSGLMIGLFYLFEKNIPDFSYKEIVFILLVAGGTYLQFQGVKKLENILFKKNIIQWTSSYGNGLI